MKLCRFDVLLRWCLLYILTGSFTGSGVPEHLSRTCLGDVNISVAVTKGVNLVDHLPLNFYSTNLIDFFYIFLRGLRKCRSAQFPGEIFFSPSPGSWDEGRKSGLRKLACGPTRS